MKRTIVEVVLALALIAAGAFGFMQWKQAKGGGGQIETLTKEVEDGAAKIEEAEESVKAAEEEMADLQAKMGEATAKAQELDAIKAGLSNGLVLADLEAAYKARKDITIDRQIGLATIRLVTKGGQDPGTIAAFNKVLQMTELGNRKAAICTAQLALAAAGQKIEVMAECKPKEAESAKKESSDKADSAKDAKDSPSKEEKPAKADKAEKTDKADKADKPDDKHAKADDKEAHKAPHWDYVGDMGPSFWGKEFPTCAKGKSQSPLNIQGPFVKARIVLSTEYKIGPLNILNNGHTIQVNVPAGSKLRIDGIVYELLQFHFHRPSEEQIDGKPMAMVAHFVHKSAAGKLAVIGVLLKEGNENPNIKTLWDNAPKQEGPVQTAADVSFNPMSLLPKEFEFYSYDGSLTTPPCTEGVRFFILKTPVNISKDQVNSFPFKMNARPLQQQNGREILIGQSKALRELLAQSFMIRETLAMELM